MGKRELKFRAWDGEKMHNDVSPWRWDFVISNTWHRCEKSTGPGVLGSGGDTAEMLVPAVRFKEIMQFTGLKDKNGTPIFEGDLMKYSDGDTPREVVFLNGSFGIVNIETEGRSFGSYNIDNGIVVGNKFQHPELLNTNQ